MWIKRKEYEKLKRKAEGRCKITHNTIYELMRLVEGTEGDKDCEQCCFSRQELDNSGSVFETRCCIKRIPKDYKEGKNENY